jgi:competence protein ComEA
MWKELWEKYRGGLLFAIGMVCFLTAGLVVRSLTVHEVHEEKIENEAPQIPQTPRTEKTEAAPETRPRQRNTKTVTGVNVLSIQEPSVPSPTRQGDGGEEDETESKWVVYITGKVRRPGVYRLSADSRLYHLVEAAGGLDSLADPVAVNMASPLEDGLHVHIPPRQAPAIGENATRALPVPPSATQPQTQQAHSTPRNERNKAKTSGSVNVNRASEEELTSLKGIGPVLARNIIKHRQENGLFRTVDDLLQVKGNDFAFRAGRGR